MFCSGPFGNRNPQENELICVQSMDGLLSFFDDRAFLFAGDILSVTMSSSVTGFDSYLALYGGGACALLTSDDDSGGGTSGRDASFTLDVTSGGDYYVVATGYSASSLGAYTLTVSF